MGLFDSIGLGSPSSAVKTEASNHASVVDQVNSKGAFTTEGERELISELLQSSGDFTVEDVRLLAGSNLITSEAANRIITTMEGSVVKLNKAAKQSILHKKALIFLAREKDDPAYKELLKLHEAKEKIYAKLESKYGQDARINEKAILNRIKSKVSNMTNEAHKQALVEKIEDFDC